MFDWDTDFAPSRAIEHVVSRTSGDTYGRLVHGLGAVAGVLLLTATVFGLTGILWGVAYGSIALVMGWLP